MYFYLFLDFADIKHKQAHTSCKRDNDGFKWFNYSS